MEDEEKEKPFEETSLWISMIWAYKDSIIETS